MRGRPLSDTTFVWSLDVCECAWATKAGVATGAWDGMATKRYAEKTERPRSAWLIARGVMWASCPALWDKLILASRDLICSLGAYTSRATHHLRLEERTQGRRALRERRYPRWLVLMPRAYPTRSERALKRGDANVMRSMWFFFVIQVTFRILKVQVMGCVPRS
jgi:hypothetical protein